MAAKKKKKNFEFIKLYNPTTLGLALHYAALRHKGDFPNILVFTLGWESAPARMEEGQDGIAER